MLATTRLNTGLFVRGEHIIVGPGGLPLPAALVEVEDRSGLLNKQRIAGKDPTSMPNGRRVPLLSQRQIVAPRFCATSP